MGLYVSFHNKSMYSHRRTSCTIVVCVSVFFESHYVCVFQSIPVRLDLGSELVNEFRIAVGIQFLTHLQVATLTVLSYKRRSLFPHLVYPLSGG
jgi:hypothetical protein